MSKIDFASKRKTVTVNVPELDASITLRALSIGQLKSLKDGDVTDSAKQLALSIVDKDTGDRVYTTDEDISALQEMSLGVWKILLEALNELHGVTPAATEQVIKN